METYHSEAVDRDVVVSPTASDDEAAAIIAAIELAFADEEAGDDAEEKIVDPWIRAGRFEAIRSFRGRPSPDAPRDPWMAMGRVRR